MREQLNTELDFIEKKLEEARKMIGNMPIVIPYDNGGGQKGIRKNPAFDAYEALLSSYIRALSSVGEVEEPKQAEVTPLELIINRRKAANG